MLESLLRQGFAVEAISGTMLELGRDVHPGLPKGRVALVVAHPGLPQIRTCALTHTARHCHAGATRRYTEWIATAGGSG